jgi:hypothetical protein
LAVAAGLEAAPSVEELPDAVVDTLPLWEERAPITIPATTTAPMPVKMLRTTCRFLRGGGCCGP